MKYLKAGAATALFLLLMLALYVIHARFFTVDVVLYSAVLDAIVAAAIAGLLLAKWRPVASVFSRFEKLQLVALWLVIGYSFAISVPAVIDRSLSIYVLEKLQQRGGSIPVAAMDRVFKDEYVREHRLMEIRLTEQQASGTIVIRDGCVVLTERGERLATLSRYFRKHFLPRQRLISGSYSADLTDPFRESVAATYQPCAR